MPDFDRCALRCQIAAIFRIRNFRRIADLGREVGVGMDILSTLEFACYGYMAAFDYFGDLAGGQSLTIQIFDDKALVPLEVLTLAPPLLFHYYSPFTNTVNCVCEKSIPQHIDKIQDIAMRYFASTRYAKS